MAYTAFIVKNKRNLRKNKENEETIWHFQITYRDSNSQTYPDDKISLVWKVLEKDLLTGFTRYNNFS